MTESIQLDKNDRILYFYHDADIWQIDTKSELTAEAEKMGVSCKFRLP